MSEDSQLYKKSVIDIHIKFDKEREKEFGAILSEKFGLRPAKVKEDGEEVLDKEGILEKKFEKRSSEIKQFRKFSQCAIEAPLLNIALVKKTKKFLKSKKLVDQELKPIQKFRSVARLVLIFVALSTRWKRYKISAAQRGRIDSVASVASRYYEKETGKCKDEKSNRKLGSAKGGKNKTRVSEEIQVLLRKSPDQRTSEDLIKVQKFCRKMGVLSIFPVERQREVAQRLGYECYDKGRVLSIQGRTPLRVYYILGGKVNMVKIVELAEGIRKRYFGELRQGNMTEATEMKLMKPRTCSLIAKTFVEVLVIEKEDFVDLIHCTPDFDGTCAVFLKSLPMFETFPFAAIEKETLGTKYFPKDTIVVKDIQNSQHFYVIKSGSCKLLQKCKVDEQGVPLVKRGFLPRLERPSLCHNSCLLDPADEHQTLREAKQLYEDVSTFLNGTKEWKQRRVKRESVSVGSQQKSLHLSVPLLREPKVTTKRKALPTLGELVFGKKDEPSVISDDRKPLETMELQLPFITINTSAASSASSNAQSRYRRSFQNHALFPQRKKSHREAYFQVGSLKTGDIYGVESVTAQAARKVQQEIRMQVPDVARHKTAGVVVVSEGSECICIDKKLFLKAADFFTLSRIATMDEENSSSNDACPQIEQAKNWEGYKKKLLDEILNGSKPPRKRVAKS